MGFYVHRDEKIVLLFGNRIFSTLEDAKMAVAFDAGLRFASETAEDVARKPNCLFIRDHQWPVEEIRYTDTHGRSKWQIDLFGERYMITHSH